MDYSNENPLTVKNFPKGYGSFPYILVRLYSAIYMQIPIHFNVEEATANFPGVQVNGIAPSLMEDYVKDKSSKLHDILIDRVKAIKETMENREKKAIRLCLVEGKDIAYFFEGNEIKFNTSIPSGGTLVNQFKKIIAMNEEHYLE